MGYGLCQGASSTRPARKVLCDRARKEHFLLVEAPERNVGDFKKLEVWQVAHKIACEVYKETAIFPKTEAYGLTAQLRRSAASVPANIAEGCGRRGDVEFSRFVRISLGSATELEYHLLLSRDIGLMNASAYASLASQVLRMQGMLAGLIRVLRGPSRGKPIAHSPQPLGP
jgi:four helix bundle protein